MTPHVGNRPLICLVSSRGGHLYQLYALRSWWKRYPRYWISGTGADADSLLRNEETYYGYFPETRNPWNAVQNFLLALRLFSRRRPCLVVSCGAGVAPPVFLAGKLLGCGLLFIDSVSFVRTPSLSARLVSLLADKVLVQHPHMVRRLFRAEHWGSVI